MRKTALHLQTRALIAGLACASVMPVMAGPDGSGYGGDAVTAEIIKRTKLIQDALIAEQEGDKLAADSDNEGAIAKYEVALATLPRGNATVGDRARIIPKYARVGVAHARVLADRGAYDKCRQLLNKILAPDIDPENKPAKVLLKNLDDSDIYNVANSEEHYNKTEEVRALFRKGLGYFDLGLFDEAQDTFNRVLAIDPYNTAARRQLERTARELSNNYLLAARDHTRAEMLNQIDKLWVTAVPGTAREPTPGGGVTGNENPTAAITLKLQSIRLESVRFDAAKIDEVIAFLRKKSIDFDQVETDPAKKGVDFILRSTTGAQDVTLDLRNPSLMEAIKAVCEQAQMKYRIEPNAVIVMPITSKDSGGDMQNRVFSVPPDFLTTGGGGDAAAEEGAADPFASGAEADKPRLAGRPKAIDVLKKMGVEFPDGASAEYNGGKLYVRNTLDALDQIEVIVENIIKGGGAKQVFITTKFVEVSQRNTDELGFDWLMGAFNMGGTGLFGSGGTGGSTGAIDTENFSFINPTTGTPSGGNPITRGLRFGRDAISGNAIDALIASQATSTDITSVSPAAFSIAGVFTDPQFQVMMRALSQKKGVDLLTAPSVIVRSGQRSKIEVIREFPYPTEYDPPQIPQTFGGGGGGLNGVGGGNSASSGFPVTPATPQSFETKNTGVTLEVEANVGDDGYRIDLNLAPEVIEFEGFINYGSPIQAIGFDALGQSNPVVLTENRILQPVFSTRKLATQVLIYDSQTVGIGGLMREDVQSVEDRVPLFGDIPLLGRLFRTKSDEHFKRNLMIYVSGHLVNPDGQPAYANKSTGDGGGTATPAPAAGANGLFPN